MAKILVIEDSEELWEMITTVLTTYQHDVIGSYKNIDTHTLITESAPKLVLLDTWVEDKSGREICRQIKKNNPGLPVILMSADPILLADHRSCNADDVLEKPFDIAELKHKIDNLLNS